MKPAQLEYLKNRLYYICDKKEGELHKKYQIPRKRLSAKQKIRMIRNGTVKMNSNKKINKIFDDSYCFSVPLEDVWDFSAYEQEAGFEPEYHKKMKQMKTAKQAIMDEVMLGSESEALKMLKKFES